MARAVRFERRDPLPPERGARRGYMTPATKDSGRRTRVGRLIRLARRSNGRLLAACDCADGLSLSARHSRRPNRTGPCAAC
jgi:hypothetical protein